MKEYHILGGWSYGEVMSSGVRRMHQSPERGMVIIGVEERRDDSFVWIRTNDGRLFQIARNAVTVWPDAVQS